MAADLKRTTSIHHLVIGPPFCLDGTTFTSLYGHDMTEISQQGTTFTGEGPHFRCYKTENVVHLFNKFVKNDTKHRFKMWSRDHIVFSIQKKCDPNVR